MKGNLSDLFDQYMFECEFSWKARPETLRGYRQTFATFMKLMPDVTLESLYPATITKFFKILHERKRVVGKGKVVSGVKKSTIATYWGKLNRFFKWLKVNKHISENPFSEMRFPTPVFEDRKFLSRHAVEKIITAVHNHSNHSLLLMKRNLAIVHVLLFCGLRREELLLLQIRDINLERRILTVRAETSKIPRTRHLPLHSQVIMFLRDYLRERQHLTTPYLFVSNMRDDRLSYEGLNHLIDKLKAKSGVKFHLHQFRHTFAVNFLKSSNNIAKLKQLMGHKSITMTMVYLRCLPTNEMRGDIENMSLDSFV